MWDIYDPVSIKGLNQRQFRMLFDEMHSMYSDLLLYNKVWWLSRGEVLKCFVVCLKEVKTFLDNKGNNYPQLEQEERREKLHYRVDMTAHLNTALQGRGLTMLENVLAFKRKFMVFVRDLHYLTFLV